MKDRSIEGATTLENDPRLLQDGCDPLAQADPSRYAAPPRPAARRAREDLLVVGVLLGGVTRPTLTVEAKQGGGRHPLVRPSL